MVLMGDIHKKQDLQAYDETACKPIVHYCGSMIQQKHDEPLKGHGYSFWTLADKQYSHVEVPNEHGFFSVIMENGVVINDLSSIPKKVKLRFVYKTTTMSEIKSALVDIKKLVEVVDVSYQNLDKNKSLTRISSSNGNIVLGDVNDQSYQTKLLAGYLKQKLNVEDQATIDAILKINVDVNNLIKKDDFSRNIRWTPIRFEFENMFSYGEGNVIDFTKAKDLIGIFAANTSGKSSIFSALTFCLFDKCERVTYAKNIMNDQKTTFSCKFEFELDGKRYFIKRDAKTDKKGKVKVDVKFWKVENGQDIDLNGEQRRNTNEVIREYLGSYEDFVLTSLSVQNGKNVASIIDMGDADRKDLFAQFMGLTLFDRLHTAGNERLRELLIMLKTFRNDDYTGKLATYQNFLEQAELLFNSEQETLTSIGKQRDLIQQRVIDTTKTLITIDWNNGGSSENVPFLDAHASLETAKVRLNNHKSIISVKEKDVEDVAKQLEQVQLDITNLESKNVSEAISQLRLFQEVKRNIEHKREQLKENYLRDMRIFEKAADIDYDPDCEFCVKHVGIIATDAREAKLRMEKIQTEASEIKIKLDSAESKISELDWSHEANVKLLGMLNTRNTLKDKQIKLMDSLNVSRQMLPKFEDQVKLIEQRIEQYNKNKEALVFNEEVNKKIAEIKKELGNVEYSYNTKSKTLTDISSKIAVCKNQISDITDKIAKIKLVEDEYKLYDLYCQAVSRNGIPFEVITATVPEIQSEVNSILTQCCEFTSEFETDGTDIIPYIVYDGRKWLMSLTSGFERFALSLAIRVALINISNLPRPNFLVLDEGFGVLDAENLAEMSSLFAYLKSSFDFILIISHLEALRDMVDNHIEVTKDNGVSKVNFV